MKISVYDTKEQIGAEVAKIIADLIKRKPDCVLGLATGASPIPAYKALIEMYKKGEISFKDVTTFNLDEYCQIPRSDKNSYFTFMHEELFDHIDIKEENVNFLDGTAQDAAQECKRYDALIDKKGGIDLQVLGIGNNAHIGFNEPTERFSSGSYKTKLSNSTIEANKMYFQNGEMPHYALTMGVSGICKSKAIVLIATGEKKAQAVYNMIKKDITPHVPASILQRHDKTAVFLDKAAASLL
ncbi:MAG: Glucosamine-6-phosphate deaminase 1 [Firmicutes bacterium ADurb.Bin300]|nr:MAG: Glucosamine-6-phosphate deaminase 1 [Firmicutes bacterium ADurb.Bin300]HOD02906.1 glucosamine-6-phosphate deaminase [Clostridiales bacterium]